MASVSKYGNGFRKLQFAGSDRKRRTIRLGKVTSREANEVKFRVERLLAARSTDFIDHETREWLHAIPRELREKLRKAGLHSEKNVDLTLAESIEQSINDRKSLSSNTKRNYLQSKRYLIEFFGENVKIESITERDADRFVEKLRSINLSPATISREIKRAKQFMSDSVKAGVLRKNPFQHLKASAQTNPSRMFFIDRETTQRVIDACPNNEWRLLVVCCRFGGMRCPSEVMGMRWSDIKWDEQRILVRSPKTEIHQKGTRLVPLFPELVPFLRAVQEQSETELVFSESFSQGSHQRTQFMRILERAKIKPWPKLFHNLRASRQTELTNQFPAHVVCAWLGNSETIAKAHYLQTTEDHFRDAVGGYEATQKATQLLAATGCRVRKDESREILKGPEFQRIPAYALQCTEEQYPQGDSNPCCRTENPES